MLETIFTIAAIVLSVTFVGGLILTGIWAFLGCTKSLLGVIADHNEPIETKVITVAVLIIMWSMLIAFSTGTLILATRCGMHTC